jgi:uncharacterized membrane protein YdjX (TVP38/TMEM64 family)
MALIVFGVNLLPAFGPPTWSILVLFRLRSQLNPVALVAVGAVAAAFGRLILAEACRRLRGRLSKRRSDNLAAARKALGSSRRGSMAALALFAVSPIPSAQLFEAAGLMDVALLPLVAVFFAGRIVSYAVYVSGASAVKGTSFGNIASRSITSPVGIGLEILMLVALVALTHIDWAGVVARRQAKA